MLMAIHRYVFFVIGLILLYLVISNIRKKRLTTEFTVLWFITSVFLLLQIIPNRLLGKLGNLINTTPVALVFIIFTLFAVSILFYYSILISRLSQWSKEILQKLAILEQELQDNNKTASSEQDRKNGQ